MLPNLVIIGAMKCGTTSLHEYLDLHPEVCMSRIKEPEFFIEGRTGNKGIEWYQSLFSRQAKIMGESSTSYSKYPTFDGVPQKMHSVIPDTKLIYVVRDPVQRIISQYVHRVLNYGEKRDLQEIIQNADNDYINYSRYYMQIERYLEYYPKARILFIDFDDLTGNTRQTMRRVFEFLDVDCHFMSSLYSVAYNQSSSKRKPNWLGLRLKRVRGYSRVYKFLPWVFGSSLEKPVMSEPLRRKLRGALKEDADKFRALSGCSFSKWCV